MTGDEFLVDLFEKVEGLTNGTKKVCPECDNIRDINDYRDSSLLTGYGRICNHCKEKKRLSKQTNRKRRSTKPRASTSIGSFSKSKTLKTKSKTASKKSGKKGKRNNPSCPKCGARMVKRTSYRGEFYGCSNYFKNGCRGTRSIRG